MQQFRLGKEWLESCPGGKEKVMLVNIQENVSWQRVQVAKKASGILACIRNSVASWTKGVIVLLYLALVRTHLQCKKDMKVQENVQRRVSKQ